MVRFIKKIRNFPFKGILMILGCFILIAAVLFAERSGVQYQEKKRQISYIDKDKIITEKEAADSLKKTCLVLRDSSQEESEQAWIEFQRIFMDMRVGTDVIDVQKDTIPDLDAYEIVVLLLSDLDPLKEKVLDICEWVEDGGSAMFALTLQKNTYVSLIYGVMDIQASADIEQADKLMDIWLCHFAGGGFVGIESGDNRMSEQRLSYNEAIKSAKLEELYRRAYKILHDNRDFLLAVQKELLEHETLLNSDLAKIRESCI